MAEHDTLRKPGARGRSPQSAGVDAPVQSPLSAPPAPAWLSAPAAAPFGIGGVQRKVTIGQSNDAYEREADQVASRVTGGSRVPPGAISTIRPGASHGIGQRESKPEEKKKDEKAAPPVQRAAKPEDTEKDPHTAAAHLQRQAKPDEKKRPDEKPAAAPVQRQSKPEDKKKDDKPAPVQRQAKPDEKKKDDKPAAPPVQRQAKPDDKKKDDKPAPVQRQAKPEEKKKDEKPVPVQRQAKPEEKKKDDKPAAVQRKIRPEDKKKEEVPGTLPVQRAEAPDKETKHDAVQASRSGSGGSAASMESAASHAIASKGPGEPLHSGTRSTLESGMGTDLSDVRVHNDSAAHSAAEALNARAFTHQSDIWLGHGESQNNLGLMAHEATHVVQQTGSVHRQLVQRAPGPAPKKDAPTPPDAAPSGDWDYEGKEGKVKKGRKMVLPLLKVPSFKKPFTPAPVTLRKKGARPDDQAQIWDKDVKGGSGLASKLDKKLAGEKATPTGKSEDPVYFLKLKRANAFVIGNKQTLLNRLARPYWSPHGEITLYQVDHQLEWQLSGDNVITNLWLLQDKANMSSGSNISTEKDNRVETLLSAAVKKDVWKEPPDLEKVRESYDITAEKVQGGLPFEGDPDLHYTRKEIKDDGSQLDGLKALNKNEIKSYGLQGSATQVVIYTNPTGGGRHLSEGWKPGMTQKKESIHFGKLFEITQVNYDPNSHKGSVTGRVFNKEGKLVEEVQLPPTPIVEMDEVNYGGYISQAGLTRAIQTKLKHLSPLQFTQLELTDKGLVGRGKVMPDIPPFNKLNVDLVIDGDDIYLSKMFSADDLHFPGPIKVTSASIEVFGGTNGVGVRGDAFFEIQSVGKGKISGKTAIGEGPSISGAFEFDPGLFDPPAKFEVNYSKGKFSGNGQLSIKQGRIKGVKSATLTGSFADDVIDFKGSVKPDIPAVEEVDFTVTYSKEAGLVIGGDLQIKKGTPGIGGGSIHAQVIKKPGADRYIVKASGEADPSIAGVSAKLLVTYDDGLFDAVATAGYEKGMLKGSITVGVTNRPVGDDGKPAGEAPPKAEKITIYGGGSVTLKISPWLQATAEIMLKPNGEVVVTGKIGLPSTLDIFPEKKLDKNIFTLKIDIPIVGISVLGHNIGIFVSIGGGLDLSAGIGPGQLQELGLEVTYNPSNEAETHISGGAKLHIPAHAGLRLFVRGALGVGIPIVDAEAGIELGGQLGIEGALDAAVQVDWTPQKGLVLDASAEIYAEPKFKFDITGFVHVEADLLFKTIELYDKRWELASVEYGSGLRFGLKLPIHYEEGKPFNLSFSDIQFEVPDVNAMDVIKGLIDKIA